MALLIGFPDLSSGQVRIYLRGRYVLMPQELLDGSQVRAVREHVRSERVPERMRAHVSARRKLARLSLDYPAHLALVDRRPALAEEHMIPACRGSIRQQRALVRQVALAGPHGRPAHKGNPLPIAFSDDADDASLEVDV